MHTVLDIAEHGGTIGGIFAPELDDLLQVTGGPDADRAVVGRESHEGIIVLYGRKVSNRMNHLSLVSTTCRIRLRMRWK